MLYAYRRHGVVIAALLAAAVIGPRIQPRTVAPAIPSISSVLAGTRWHVSRAYRPGGWSGLAYGEWLLRDATGHAAALYLGVSTKVQTRVHWNGELGYEGEGYVVLSRGRRIVALPDGNQAPTNIVVVRRMADRQLLQYAVVGPDGISASSTDNPFQIAWDTLRGSSSSCYLVRVAVMQLNRNAGAATEAEDLIAPVLSWLRRRSRSDAS